MTGTYIDIKAFDGGSFKAYKGTPPGGSGPGLIVIQEIFGVNSHIRNVVDDFARQGYTVLAPDVFWRAEPGVELGYSLADMQRGSALRAQIEPGAMLRDLQSCVAHLAQHGGAKGQVAAVGYCMGGRLAFELAATGDIVGAIAYYGGGIGGLLSTLAGSIKIPLQFHYGVLDKHITHEEVASVREAFANRSEVEVFAYDEADHGFNNDEKASFNADAAQLARTRTLEFLKTTLGP